MSLRFGNAHSAFGRWLILALLFAPYSAAHSQDESAPPPIEQGQGVTKETPAREEQRSEQPGPDAAEPEQSPPAPPLQNKGTEEPPCGPRCQAREQREKDDLVAQQSMAGSTIEMKCAAWWQVGLSFAAVILVGMTARYAYRAAVAAEKINFITQDSAERQLRAYLSATPHFQGRDVTRQPPSYTIAIKNHGNTPAYDVAVWLDGVLNAYPSNEEWFTQGEPTGPIRVINPGEEQHSNGFFEKVLDAETAREIMAGTARFYFWGEITYRDAFATERRFLRFRYMFGGPSARLGKVDVCENGNEAN